MLYPPDYKEEEILLHEAVMYARKIQDYLWGDLAFDINKHSFEEVLNEYIDMFKKRVAKIDDIDWTKSHAMVELRKRVLQQAAISLKLLWLIDKETESTKYKRKVAPVREATNEEIRKAFQSTETVGKPYGTTDGYINTLKSTLHEQGLDIVKIEF